MRKHAILFISLLTAFACVREETVDTGVKTFDCFTVTVEDSPMTKVHMEDGGAVKWDVGDCIGVYSDMQAPVQYRRGEDGKFYGEKVSGTTFYAFYPYNDGAYNPQMPLKLRLSLGDDEGLPMVAKNTDNKLCFKQVCGMIHIVVSSPLPYSWVGFHGSQKKLGGRGHLDLSLDNPVLYLDGDDSGNYEMLTIPFIKEQKGGKEDIYYYLPPTIFEDGLSLIFGNVNNSGDNICKTTHKKITICRGEMVNLSVDLSEELSAKINGQPKEREALIELYNALDGDNWVNNTNWCTDKPIGEWFGVGADDNGHVTLLHLGGNNLRGQLPDVFSVFTELRQLYLMCDHISGPLPNSIGELCSLEELDMQGYGVLEDLYDESNRLTGPLPEWIGNLKNLRILDLSNQMLSGDLPNSLSNLHLESLVLGNNFFTGSLPVIPVTNKMDLRYNKISGQIPPDFASLLDISTINEIDIFYNCLSGPLPREIVNHPRFHQFAYQFIYNQRDSYKIEIDENHVPARKDVYETLDGGSFNLGEAYSNAELTMIVRWAEWCSPSRDLIPSLTALADKYSVLGLQTIWAYGGGSEDNRDAYMSKSGLDKRAPHIIERYDENYTNFNTDKVLWFEFCGYRVPLIELVNKDGCIVFIDDDGSHKGYSFCRRRSQLEAFLSNYLGGGDEYLSTDFSADGTVHSLQKAAEGAGINVVLMGDAFSDRLIADGTYEKVMRNAMDALFSEEPYKSYKEYFNVYYVDVVSKNEVYYGETALNTYYGDGSEVGGDDDKVFKYAGKVLTDNEMDDALIIVMLNHDNYAGTCYMYSEPDGDYGRGPSISYFPTSSDAITFNGMVSHEAGGHGFAKLADEYDYPGTISEEEEESYKNMGIYGWWKNADFTSDPTRVKWAKFITDDRYASENIGVFEGACTYQYGAWRPTEESIMRHNIGGFNAPSREAIYYRIHKLAYGSNWEYNYEEFVTWDLAHRTPAATSARSARTNFVEREFEPLAPPVVVNKDWRKVVIE